MRRFKRIYILVTSLILLPLAVSLAKDISFEALVDRTKVSLGNSIQLNLTFNNTQNIPGLDLPQTEGFGVRYIGPSSSISIVNGVTSSSITHIYMLQAVKIGKFTLGPFEFEHNGDNYTSNKIDVEVVQAQALPGASGGGQQARPQGRQEDLSSDLNDRIFVILETSKNEIFVNELVELSVRLYVNKLGVRDIQFPQIESDGVSIGQFSQPKQYSETIAGVIYDVIEFKTTVFGIRPGEPKIGPATINCNLIAKKQTRRKSPSLFDDDFFGSNVFDDFFGRFETRPLTLNSRSVPVTVRPLPEEARPDGFSGAIGDFSFDVSVNPIEVKVGDPITMRMTVKGKGNISTVKVPSLETTKDFKVYEPQVKQSDDRKVMEQVIMPMNADIRLIPAILFSFFNPETQKYETITRGPFAISVTRPEKEEESKVIDTGSARMPQSGKDEKFGRDIIFIKEWEGYPARKGAFLARDGFFIWFQLIALLAYLCLALYRGWKSRLSCDVRYARKLQAPGVARCGIARAKKLLKDSKRQEFYDELFNTLQGYMGDRFHLSSGSITAGIIDEILKPRNADREILEKLADIFRDCDMARYAPSGIELESMHKSLSDLEDIIDYFQRNKI
jgi:hypothetical protein